MPVASLIGLIVEKVERCQEIDNRTIERYSSDQLITARRQEVWDGVGSDTTGVDGVSLRYDCLHFTAR